MISRPDLEGAPLGVRMMYPGDYWDEDWDEEKEKELEEAEDEFEDATVCCVVDADADGLGCEVLLREGFPNETVGVVQAGHRKDIDTSTAISLAAEMSAEDSRLIVADLCPDEEELDDILFGLGAFDDVMFLDHHDWTDEARNAIESEGELVHDSTKCAAQLVLQEFFSSPPDYLVDFAEVTADHDLWIKEDTRSDDLKDYAFWGEREDYVESARKYGAEITQSESVQELLDTNREEKNKRIDLALNGINESVEDSWNVYQEGADWIEIDFDTTTVSVEKDWYENNISDSVSEEDITEDERVEMLIEGPITVAFLYGEMYASEAGERAQENGADVAVIIPPYNKISIRSKDDVPLAAKVAQNIGGGGHPVAAGAEPDIVGGGEDKIDYDVHWDTRGLMVKREILEEIKSVIGV